MEKNRKIYLVIITTLCMFILFFGWYKTFEQKDVYIDLLTKAAPDSNYAMFVPADTIVIVETAWGDELHTNVLNVPHGDGDYLVCRKGEDGKPDLSDVWVLNGVIFQKTYDISNKSK